MTSQVLRSAYLAFFKDRGHAILPSSPLVPENDPTTLFTSSGMQPLVPYLLGQEHPSGTRLTDSQKSFRSQDIEEVGDNRHTTFFEMLGNWSLGDYFKKEQLHWVFEFLTGVVGLNPENLYVSVFAGNSEIDRDDDAISYWQEIFSSVGIEAKLVEHAQQQGMQGGRIFSYDESKNWWSRSGVPEKMPVGEPGGPDSEIFFDFGKERKLHEHSPFADQPCHINCDCGRFMEIGNSVFMQFQKTSDGRFSELPKRNVDFGGGLERMLAAENNDPDVFLTDLFQPIITELEKLSGKKYGEEEETTRSFRVIADHVKAAVMLASDGVYPSNKTQGYFSRRLIRRAIRYAQMISISDAFLEKTAQAVAGIYQDQYPNVREHLPQIVEGLTIEEEKFRKTLAKGLKEIEKISVLDGKNAFMLYETYGFPLELTQEIAKERGQVVDPQKFEDEFVQHKEQSRTASVGMFKGGLQDHSEVTTQYHTTTHLLHAALRKILGTHVQQKGSNITVERLRFDFSHPKALTQEEKQQVEDQINVWIQADLPVTVQTMQKQDALQSGAIAFFIEKYPDTVTVYTIGKDVQTDWVSKELCGGPHVQHTGEIGAIKIVKEESAGAGVRRIYIQLEK